MFIAVNVSCLFICISTLVLLSSVLLQMYNSATFIIFGVSLDIPQHYFCNLQCLFRCTTILSFVIFIELPQHYLCNLHCFFTCTTAQVLSSVSLQMYYSTSCLLCLCRCITALVVYCGCLSIQVYHNTSCLSLYMYHSPGCLFL